MDFNENQMRAEKKSKIGYEHPAQNVFAQMPTNSYSPVFVENYSTQVSSDHTETDLDASGPKTNSWLKKVTEITTGETDLCLISNPKNGL